VSERGRELMSLPGAGQHHPICRTPLHGEIARIHALSAPVRAVHGPYIFARGVLPASSDDTRPWCCLSWLEPASRSCVGLPDTSGFREKTPALAASPGEKRRERKEREQKNGIDPSNRRDNTPEIRTHSDRMSQYAEGRCKSLFQHNLLGAH
jgi:hypothetical protein